MSGRLGIRVFAGCCLVHLGHSAMNVGSPVHTHDDSIAPWGLPNDRYPLCLCPLGALSGRRAPPQATPTFA
eukprot:9426616-Prorocentrum_lima.AAC.1